jgi:hypothetical protein
MDGYIYLLTKGGIEEIEYVLYDLKEALLKAQEMSLTIYRIRMRDQGATVMKIFTP